LADQSVQLDLLQGATHPDGFTVRLMNVGLPQRGELDRTTGSGAVYKAPKLFIGTDTATVKLVDDMGMMASAVVTIEVKPNPVIGVPFEDGAFFEDETGWELEPTPPAAA
jgi:hypothetical protein